MHLLSTLCLAKKNHCATILNNSSMCTVVIKSVLLVQLLFRCCYSTSILPIVIAMSDADSSLIWQSCRQHM